MKSFRSDRGKKVQQDFASYHRDIVFEGTSRLDAKRAMLRYWSRHQNRMDLEFDQFMSRCRLQDDNKTIIFRA